MKKRKWTDEEIESFHQEHGVVSHFFYFNRADTNILVPRKIIGLGRGLTFNWANPITWVVMAGVIGLLIWINLFK